MASAAALRLRSLHRLVQQKGLWGYAAGLSTRGLEVLGKFGLYALAARQLGKHDSGLFFLCLSWATLACTASRMGLERPTIRQLAAGLGVGRGLAARAVLITSGRAAMLASILAGAVTFVVAQPAARLLFDEPELATPLRITALLIPIQTLTWVAGYTLMGLKRGVAAQLLLSALPPTLTVAWLLLGTRDADLLLIGYMASFGACGLVGLILIGYDWSRKLIDTPPPPGKMPECLQPLHREARPFFVVEMTQTAVQSLPTLILGAFAPPDAVSEFSIAARLSNLVNTVILSIGIIAAPSFAEHYHRGDMAAFRRVDRQAQILTLVLTIPVVLVMVLAPTFLLHLMGRAFGSAAAALVVMALGQFVNALLPMQDTVLAMTGHGNALRRLNVLQLICCVVLGFLLIPFFGIMGAAITTAAALILYSVGCAWVARKLVR